MQDWCGKFLSIPAAGGVSSVFGEMVLPPCGFVAKWEWGARSTLWCL